MKKIRILAIDPSVMNSAGYAVVEMEWSADGKKTKEDWAWGAWPVSGMNFVSRCSDLKDRVAHEIEAFDVLVLEWPMFYDSGKGHMAARQGYTVNLAGIAMYLAGWFQVPRQRVFLYTAPAWKGMVTKAVTARRFFKLFGESEVSVDHNAIDATMMLVFHCEQQLYNAEHKLVITV